MRFAALLVCYLLLPAFATAAIDLFSASDSGMMLFISILFIAFPLITIALAAWDGITEGFTILWTFLPVLFFLAPMFIFFNESALIYGAIYSVLAMTANGIGNCFHLKPHNTNKPRES